jgi:hypothetical protein
MISRSLTEPANELPISRAAVLNRDSIIAETGCQNRGDLARRERRRLDGRVGRRIDCWSGFREPL